MIATSLLQELDTQGYVVVPGFLDGELTAAIRAHIDQFAPPVSPADEPDARRVHDLRHPLPGAIMARIITPALIEFAQAILKSPGIADLRLLEQVLIRTDPGPAPPGPTGWHVDWAFLPGEYAAVPRQTYYHMVHACSTVELGGGAFMIVPGSHHCSYATSAQRATAEELGAFQRKAAEAAGVDLAAGIEVCPNEGDLIVFNPMCLHSASRNIRSRPRYVYFASFFDISAHRLCESLRVSNYLKGFSDDLRAGLPASWRGLLEWLS